MTSKRWIVVFVAVAAIAGASWLFLRPHKRPRRQASSDYADPKTCLNCHRDEAAGYDETGMAHAFYIPSAAVTVDSPAKMRTFYHQASSTWYSLTVHDGVSSSVAGKRALMVVTTMSRNSRSTT